MSRDLRLVQTDESDDSAALAQPASPGGGNGGWIVSVERRLTKIEAQIQHRATEASVERIRTEIEGVRTEIAGVRTDVSNVRTEISDSTNRLIKWIVGTAIALAGVAIAAVSVGTYFLARVLLPILQSAASSSPPG